jgi:hypothetical protein
VTPEAENSTPPGDQIVSWRDSPGLFTSILSALVLLAMFTAGALKWADQGYNVDVTAAAFPAWHFVQTGSLDMSGYEGENPWFITTDTGTWSNRSPGIIGVAIVAYTITEPFTDDFEMWPSAVAAVLTTFASVLVVAGAARRLRPDLFLPTMLLLGLGTATWGVASGQLWPHGPAQLMVALALSFAMNKRWTAVGLALGVGILIRPPIAIVALVLGLGFGFIERSWRPVVKIGWPSALGALFLAGYSALLFGSLNPTAAYDSAGGLIREGDGFLGWLLNVVQGLFGPRNGLLVWSPWILVAGIGLFAMRKRLGPEPKLWLFASAIFLLVHFWLNRASGGLPYNYRYPIEVLALITPAVLLSLPDILDRTSTRFALIASAGMAVFLQAAYLLFSTCTPVGDVAQCSLFG